MFKATQRFNGIKIEDAPNGFAIEVSYGNFNSEEEAQFHLNNYRKKFFYDDSGFCLELKNTNNEKKVLRIPDIHIEVRKNEENLELPFDRLSIWNINTYKLGLEIPYYKKRVFEAL